MASNNKIACIHITRNDIRLAEGRVSDGVMMVTKTAIIPQANRFFHGERLAFMEDMVNAVVDCMKVNSFMSKTIHIVYDNGVDVQFYIDEKLLPKKTESKGLNFNLSFGKKSEQDEQKKKDTGTIVHKKAWGKYITEIDKGELHTTVTMERDMVNFLVAEFQEKGYRVASLEVPETALLYMRNFVPYSYDAMSKLVIYANNKSEGVFYQFTKDVPAGTTSFRFDDVIAEDFPETVYSVIKEEIRKKGLVNPHVMLVGDAFEDEDEYRRCCEILKEEGLYCIDNYALWRDRSAPTSSLRVITPETGVEIELNGKFGLCIALLIRTLEPKPENMVEGIHVAFIDRQTKRTLVEVISTLAALFFIYAVIGAGIGGFEVMTANREYQRASSATEATLQLAKGKRDSVKAQVENLSTIDSRYNEIFKFVYEQVDENLNIASVDTENLIPAEEKPNSTYEPSHTAPTTDPNQTPEGEINGSSEEKAYKMQTIVIRGYSRTTNGPVELYNALVGAGLGEVKVVGVEQVPLPSGETLFAFELTVGSTEGG